MYTHEDIRKGSIVVATGRSGDTSYHVVSVGTKLLGEDSFLGTDLKEYPVRQLVSCSQIKEIKYY